MRIDWQGIAQKHGYRDDRLMLMDLYNVRHLSALNVGLKIGVSTTAIFRRLRELGLRMRPAKCNRAMNDLGELGKKIPHKLIMK